jgi:probable F420-dependent oxidoreductase
MKIGTSIGVGLTGHVDVIKKVAAAADRLGFSTLWAAEHVVLFDRYSSKYPYAENFNMPGDTAFSSPMILLTYAAAVTDRIRPATGICIVPEHNPVVLAKDVATLDYLSRGRFILGVGLGWSEEEFSAVGVPFERRARRTIEYLEVMRRLWTEERTTFKGEFVNLDARSYPKPHHGAPPIFFGGESDAALRRVAQHGVGWFGVNLTPDQVMERRRKLEEFMKARGRRVEEVEVVVANVNPVKLDEDLLKRYRDAGLSELILGPQPARPARRPGQSDGRPRAPPGRTRSPNGTVLDIFSLLLNRRGQTSGPCQQVRQRYQRRRSVPARSRVKMTSVSISLPRQPYTSLTGSSTAALIAIKRPCSSLNSSTVPAFTPRLSLSIFGMVTRPCSATLAFILLII